MGWETDKSYDAICVWFNLMQFYSATLRSLHFQLLKFLSVLSVIAAKLISSQFLNVFFQLLVRLI